jgi:8-oxo-dGTP diphosphatase
MDKKRVFGQKEPGAHYVSRVGAYVVIPNEQQQLILVQAPNGAYFLPGGEIEAGETKEETVRRELIEELGFKGDIACYLGEAVDYFYSRHRDTYYYHPAYFYLMTKWQKIGEPTEAGNQLSWHAPEEAIRLLKRGSHSWAVKQWLTQKDNELA